MPDRILLTGVSGYLGGHIALQLLNAGYEVLGSLRSLDRADEVRETLARQGADTTRLHFVALDLLNGSGWVDAARGCRYLLHTASPLVLRMPNDPMELIKPAVSGTERALDAANVAGVDRVVLTSSMAAIAYGHGTDGKAGYGASDWTDADGPGVNAYQKSKTLAERRAWAIMDQAGRHDALVSINPSIILGPVMGNNVGASASLIQRLLNGSLPGLPRVSLSIADVRDVAALHIVAMTSPDAGGHRYPVGPGSITLRALSGMLQAHYPDRPIARLAIPDWVVRLYGLIDSDVAMLARDLGQSTLLESSAAQTLLNRPLHEIEAAVLSTASSLLDRM